MKQIKIVGFDLDQTLYPKSPQIDESIQEYIYKRIAEFRNCSIDESRKLFCKHFPALSGRKTLLLLGIPEPEQIIQDALENADIARFLKPDKEVHELLQHVKGKYGSLSLITGSSHQVCKNKLEALQIPIDWFDFIIAGGVSKSDGTAFQIWMNEFREKDKSLLPENFLYIGDRASTDALIPLSLGIQAALVYVTIKDSALPALQFYNMKELAEYLF